MEVTDELKAAALAAFNPLTFILVTSTPNNVNIDLLTDTLKQGGSFSKEVLEIDIKKLLERVSSARGPSGRASMGLSKQSSTNLFEDTTRSSLAAGLIRNEWVRLAVAREVARREAAAARDAERQRLLQQYLEDGLSEAAARLATEQDLHESDLLDHDAANDEDDEEDGAGGGGAYNEEAPHDAAAAERSEKDGAGDSGLPERRRPKLFLCLRGYAGLGGVEPLLGLAEAEVRVDVLYNVQAAAPLPGSVGMERREGPPERAGARHPAKSITGRGSVSTATGGINGGITGGGGKRGGRAGETAAELPLFRQVEAMQRGQRGRRHSGLSGVLVCDYTFPAMGGAPTSSMGTGLAAGVRAIRLRLRQLEFLLYRYRQWTRQRRVVEVPVYTPPPPPPPTLDALGRPLLSESTDHDGERRTSTVFGRSRAGIPLKKQSNITNCVANESCSVIEAIESVDELKRLSPCCMADVAARRVEYTQSLTERKARGQNFSVPSFVQSCVLQSCSTEAHLLTLQETQELALKLAKDNAAHQVMCISQEIDGFVPRVQSTPSCAKGENVEEEGKDDLFSQDDGQYAVAAAEEAVSAGDITDLLSLVKRALSGCPHFAHQSCAGPSNQVEKSSQPLLSKEHIQEALACAVVQSGKGDLGGMAAAAKEMNQQGWCRCERVSCGPDGSCLLDVYFRGDGAARMQHIVHNFTQHTTFPLFTSCWEFCAAEGAYFYPPPPDSDEDTDLPDEETETETDEDTDEEDTDDSDGENSIAGLSQPTVGGPTEGKHPRGKQRKASAPPPPPPEDHLGLQEAALLRRRVYEDVWAYVQRPIGQEVEARGLGARSGVEAVSWMTMADGCTVEVQRMDGNVRQLVCNLSCFAGLRCGYVFTEGECTRYEMAETGGGVAPSILRAQIPSHLQCFVAAGAAGEEPVTVRAEVVVDVTAEAALEAYEHAVEAAKEDAKLQYESLTSRPARNSRGREKTSSKPISLAELEETCIAAIPKPPPREPMPPIMELTAVLAPYHCTALFHPLRHTAQLSTGALRGLELSVCVWKDDHLQTLHVRSYQHLIWSTTGFVEIISEDAEGYRIILSCKGSYMTTKPQDGVYLWVDVNGRCFVRKVDGSKHYAEVSQLQGSSNVSLEPPLQNCIQTRREDGIEIVRDARLNITRVYFKHEQIWVEWCRDVNKESGESEDVCTWFVRGLPAVTCCPSRRRVSLRSTSSVVIQVDFNQHTLALNQGQDCSAILNWDSYEMEVSPVPSAKSLYAIDCALGGLYGEVQLPGDSSQHVYRVSPLGRCSEEVDKGLVLPASYKPTQGPQPLVLYQEVLNPFFVEAFHNTGLRDRIPTYLRPSPVLSSSPSKESAAPVKTTSCEPIAQDEDATVSSLLSAPPTHSKDLLRCELHRKVGDKNTATVYFFSHRAMANLVSHWRCMGRTLSIQRPVSNPQEASADGYDCYLLAPRRAPEISQTHLPTEERHQFSPSVCAVVTDKNEIPSISAELVMISRGSAYGDWNLETVCTVSEPEWLVGQVLQQSPPSQEETGTDPCPNEVSSAQDGNPSTEAQAAEATAGEEVHLSPPRSGHGSGGRIPNQSSGKTGRLNYWHCLSTQPTFLAAPPPISPLPEQAMPCEAATQGVPEAEATALVAADMERLSHVELLSQPPSPSSSLPAAAAQMPAIVSRTAIPLMHSKLVPCVTGKGASKSLSRCPLPQLRIAPDVCDFGDILAGSRYGMVFYVTNTSTIPCRYRVTMQSAEAATTTTTTTATVAVPTAKSYLSLSYPRKFLAPGLTEAVEVVLGGMQPPGEAEVVLLVSHEGGCKRVAVHWKTLEDVDDPVPLRAGVTFLGSTPPEFKPGSFLHPRASGGNEMSVSSLALDDSINILMPS